MSKNFQAFLKLDKSRLTNKYIVMVDSKIVETGHDIQKLLKRTKDKYPSKTPFIAKIPSPELLVL